MIISGNYARGSMSTAHNSADSFQYVVCDVFAYASGSNFAHCYFRNADGTAAAGCTTSQPAHIQIVAALTSDAEIAVTWDSNGRCDYMSVRAASWLPRKQ